MEPFNPKLHYSLNELSTITGINLTRFYSYKEKLNIRECIFPSKRKGYCVHFEDFETALEESKTFDFYIPEFQQYQSRKRPIVRQFLNAKEVTRFLDLIGEDFTIYTIQRRIREEIYPSYALERKYIIPIISVIRKYALNIDEGLNARISKVINEPYKFQL